MCGYIVIILSKYESTTLGQIIKSHMLYFCNPGQGCCKTILLKVTLQIKGVLFPVFLEECLETTKSENRQCKTFGHIDAFGHKNNFVVEETAASSSLREEKPSNINPSA